MDRNGWRTVLFHEVHREEGGARERNFKTVGRYLLTIHRIYVYIVLGGAVLHRRLLTRRFTWRFLVRLFLLHLFLSPNDMLLDDKASLPDCEPFALRELIALVLAVLTLARCLCRFQSCLRVVVIEIQWNRYHGRKYKGQMCHLWGTCVNKYRICLEFSMNSLSSRSSKIIFK